MIEVLKQAFDALEDGDYWEKQEAMTSLRQAIAELESQEPVAKVIDWGIEGPRLKGLTQDWPMVGTLLYTHPPQRTEQEGKQMIDWYSVEGETRGYGVGMVECAYAIGRDEVVHVVTHESVKDIAMQHLPIQRTWVGLTDDEIIDVIHPLVMADMPDQATNYEIARAIEAKLKELNT